MPLFLVGKQLITFKYNIICKSIEKYIILFNKTYVKKSILKHEYV